MLATSLERTLYDSLYLTLAIARGAVLVTADRKLHSAIANGPLAKFSRWIEESL